MVAWIAQEEDSTESNVPITRMQRSNWPIRTVSRVADLRALDQTVYIICRLLKFIVHKRTAAFVCQTLPQISRRSAEGDEKIFQIKVSLRNGLFKTQVKGISPAFCWEPQRVSHSSIDYLIEHFEGNAAVLRSQ